MRLTGNLDSTSKLGEKNGSLAVFINSRSGVLVNLTAQGQRAAYFSLFQTEQFS